MSDFIGTAEPDNIAGTAGDDSIAGLGGNDIIDALDGNDVVDGGDGDDTIDGGAGADVILGGNGNDVLQGDTLYAGAGTPDQIYGGEGDDRIAVGLNDHAEGGNGRDSLGIDLMHAAAGATVDLSPMWGGGSAILGSGGVSGFEVLDYFYGTIFDDVFTVGDVAATQETPPQIYGRFGDDSLTGGASRDGLFGGDGNDTLRGLGGRDDLRGEEGNDVLDGGDGNDELDGGAGEDRLYGGAGDDQLRADGWFDSGTRDELYGGDGDDAVTAGYNDVADGGAGRDSLVLDFGRNSSGVAVDLTALWTNGSASLGSGQVSGFEVLEYIIGSEFNDALTVGTSGTVRDGFAPPFVLGRGGDDLLTGGADRDALDGGDGDDTLRGLAGNDQLSGGGGDDTLEGGEGDDFLTGGGGADRLVGGDGDDLYFYSGGNGPAEDMIIEHADGAGIDTIEITFSTALTDGVWAGVRNVEVAQLSNLTPLGGTEFELGANFQASGISHVIASATIDASAMTQGLTFEVISPNLRNFDVSGTSGDDVFVVTKNTVLHNGVQTVHLAGGAGTDILSFDDDSAVATFSNNILGSSFGGFEVLRFLPGIDAIDNPTGPDVRGVVQRYSVALRNEWMPSGDRITIDASTLRGSVVVGLGANGEIGGSGTSADVVWADTIQLDASGLTGGRSIYALGGAGADSFIGSAASDTIVGDGGNDLLIGGGGRDILIGGVGDDLYEVDDASDIAFESAGAGFDQVFAYVDLTLPDHVEALVMSYGVQIYGFGNSSDNLVIGNASANALAGFGGNDRIEGLGGNDTLDGGAGNDVLLGGLGADSMAGGDGDDLYEVDNVGDRLFEAATGGSADTVYAYVSLTLAAHVENLVMVYGSQRSGTGNDGNNVIIGNATDNVLEGGRGYDTLTGGAGSDQFVVRPGFGVDVVTDFVAGASSGDIILFANGMFANFTAIMANAAQVGSDTWIGDGLGNTLVLSGVAMSSLQADDFGFI